MTAARVSPNELTALASLLDQEEAEGLDSPCLGPHLEASLYAPLREMLRRPGKEFRARLCEQAHALAGGTPGTLPPELPLTVEVLHAGSLIIDDIEDRSEQRRGGPTLHRIFDMPVALNAGNWLYFLPLRLLERADLTEAARASAHARMGECLLRCHEGQALDLTVRVGQLSQTHAAAVVRGMSERKTGALIGLAAAFGGLAAGATRAETDALEHFGCQLGVGLQMLDDLSGVANPARVDKGLEDLRLGRATWVWAWLAEDTHEQEYDELIELLADAGSREQAAGTGDDDPLRDLVEHLRFRLGVTGQRRARLHLERAVRDLASALMRDDFCKPMMDELHRLERGFLEVSR